MPAPRTQSALVLGAITRDLEGGQAAVPGRRRPLRRAARSRRSARARVRSRACATPMPRSCSRRCARPASRCARCQRRDHDLRERLHRRRGSPRAARRVGSARARTTCRLRGAAPTRSTSGRCTGATSCPRRSRCLSGFTGIDLQGLVRLADEHGTRLAPNPELKDFLAHVSVAKASEEELAVRARGPQPRSVPQRVRTGRAPGDARRARRARGDTLACRGDRRCRSCRGASPSARATCSWPPTCTRARASAARSRRRASRCAPAPRTSSTAASGRATGRARRPAK